MTNRNRGYYIIIKPSRQDFMTNSTDEENEIMGKHFLYLKSLLETGKLFFAGPTLIETDPFGVIILQIEDEREAEEIIRKDPSIKAGIQSDIDFRPIALSLTP